MIKTYIGVDLGGTKLLVGEIDVEGNVLRYERFPSGFSTQKEAADAIEKAVKLYQEKGCCGKPAAIGAGLVGIVDHENGVWHGINHTVLQDYPIAERLSNAFGLPCSIDNDVRSAATAELILGSGKECKNFIYINVGTGIAAGFVVNGKMIRGANCNAGEIGHMVVLPERPAHCICGRTGCVEAFAAGIGFSKRANLLAGDYPETRLTINKSVDVAQVFRLSNEGDDLCKRLVQDAAEALAIALMNAVRVTDPELVIFGGGVVSDGYLIECMKPYLNSITLRGVKRGIRLSHFDPNKMGLIGAAAVAMC